jgi:hypothetical protein
VACQPSTGGAPTGNCAALRFAVKHGAQLSISAPRYDREFAGAGRLQNAFMLAETRNVLVVVAAPNTPDNMDAAANWLPGTYPFHNIIHVTGHCRELKLLGAWGKRSVDIAAPAEGIFGPTAGGGYRSGCATSFATPLVTGALALVWGLLPNLQTDRRGRLSRNAQWTGQRLMVDAPGGAESEQPTDDLPAPIHGPGVMNTRRGPAVGPQVQMGSLTLLGGRVFRHHMNAHTRVIRDLSFTVQAVIAPGSIEGRVHGRGGSGPMKSFQFTICVICFGNHPSPRGSAPNLYRYTRAVLFAPHRAQRRLCETVELAHAAARGYGNIWVIPSPEHLKSPLMARLCFR